MDALAELPGLTSAKRLAEKLCVDSPVHALLLYGTSGAGQSNVARALSKAWLCPNATAAGACGACQSCTAFERGANADFQLIEPHGAGNLIKQGAIIPEKKKGDPLPTVPVSEFVRTPPLMSRHKVAVFEQAERMNPAASNAFLKTLEEPHPYVRFLLVTSEIGRILPTIRSRCVAASCELPLTSEIEERIGDRSDIFAVAPHFVDRFAEDRSGYDRARDFVRGLGALPRGAALRAADDFRELCSDLIDEDERERQAVIQGLELLATLISRQHPDRPDWVHSVLRAHRRVLGNVNPSVVLDALFAEMLAGQ